MALTIEKNLSVLGGVSVSQLYVRLFVVLNYSGRKIVVNTETYVSEAAFDERTTNSLLVFGIPESIEFDYDRSTDGTDLLQVAHNKMKEYLTTDKYFDAPKLDENEKYMFDENGHLIIDKVVIESRFAEPEEVSISI